MVSQVWNSDGFEICQPWHVFYYWPIHVHSIAFHSFDGKLMAAIIHPRLSPRHTINAHELLRHYFSTKILSLWRYEPRAIHSCYNRDLFTAAELRTFIIQNDPYCHNVIRSFPRLVLTMWNTIVRSIKLLELRRVEVNLLYVLI